MITDLFTSFPGFFELLRSSAEQQPSIYLVGGAVRDLLLNRQNHDLDFITTFDPRPLARRLANAFDGDFYMLDEARLTARVILTTPGPEPQKIISDFALLRAPTLQADLEDRDFTINAIAIDLSSPDQLIDPLNGAQALKDRHLIPCSPSAFRNDPLRILRMVRLALTLNCQVDNQTRQSLRASIPYIGQVSAERVRDELFRIFDGKRVAAAIRLLDKLGVLPYILPELQNLKGVTQSPPHTLPVWEHTLATIQELETIYDVFVSGKPGESAENLPLGSAVYRLGHFRRQFRENYQEQINPNRSGRSLLMFAALYHDTGKPQTYTVDNDGRIRFFNHEVYGAGLAHQRAQELTLAANECDHIERIVAQHMRVHALEQVEGQISRRAIHRFFRDTQTAGIDVCLLSLADVRATYGVNLTQEHWEKKLDICHSLLDAWWNKKAEIILPSRLLNGNELMEALQLSPGPLVGNLLEAILEAQAAGEISTQQEALNLAHKLLINKV